MVKTISFVKKIIKTSLVLSSLLLFFPLLAHAHLIEITATKPFPEKVPASSSSIATYTVSNISKVADVTVIDQSQFTRGSGLSVASSTCGQLLKPGQSCEIHVRLQAKTPGTIISGTLRAWAKPTADGVQYPINVKVTESLPQIRLEQIDSQGLPALREPIVAEKAGNWLILSGALGSFHDFDNMFNTDIYVYNPATMTVASVSIDKTDLPQAVKDQLSSSDPEFLQDGDTLYIIGGFYNPPNSAVFTTLNTITSINIPGMMNAILNNQTDLATFVAVNTSIPEFKVTGGQLGKIGEYFYLTFGQDCEGDYCARSQVYTNSIYQFTTTPALTSINIVNRVTHGDLDGSGWRRRDYTLVPLLVDSTEKLFALAGPFTPGNNALVWTNGIIFDADLHSNDQFIQQQANQYSAPALSMYHADTKMSFVATFAGLSNLYWDEQGLQYNNFTPYGNVLDLITVDSSGAVAEYANVQPLCSEQPLVSCVYMGLAAEFIPVTDYYDARGILQLGQLPQGKKTVIGYVYGGLISSDQNVFGTGAAQVTNQVYAVSLTPQGSGAIDWENVSDLFS